MNAGQQLSVRARVKPAHGYEVNSWNLFARLDPRTAQSLRNDALQHKDDSLAVDPTCGWQLTDAAATSSSCESGIEFLPLSIAFPSSSTIVYVSYNGGSVARDAKPSQVSPTIEIPDSVMPEDTDTVTVKVIPYVTNAAAVYVEPVDTCDWELLETHADFLESGGLLQQVCIVYPNQVLPLWVGGRDFCFVNVLPRSFESAQDEEEWLDSDDDSSTHDSLACFRLVADTEVIVTPKPRSSATKAPRMSAPLRVIPTYDDWSTSMKQLQEPPLLRVPPLTVFGRADTLRSQLPGWTETSNQTFLAVVWKSHHENQQVEERLLRCSTSQEAAVVCVGESEDVPEDHIAIHPSVRHQLGVTPLYNRVRLKLIHADQATSGSASLRDSLLNQTAALSLDELPDGTNEAPTKRWLFPYDADSTPSAFQYLPVSSSHESESLDISQVRSVIASWLDLPDVHGELPVSTGSLISIPRRDTSSTKNAAITYRLAYRSPRIPHSAPSAVETPLFVLAKDLLSTISLSTSIINTLPSHSSSSSVEGAEMGSSSSFDDEETTRIGPPFELLLNALPPTPNIPKDLAEPAHAVLRSSVGHVDAIVFTGETGSGKTHAALFLAAWARLENAHATIYLDCKKLQTSTGVQMKDILNELTETFQIAFKARPSVLILDDLDEIAPSMHADSSDDDTGSIQHQQVNPIAIAQSKLISDHIQALVQETRSMQYRETDDDPYDVSMIFTCRDQTSISSTLTSGQAFPLVAAVPNVGGADREEMLKHMLQRAMELDLSADVLNLDFGVIGFAKKSEGFRPRDLEILAMRAGHTMYAAAGVSDSTNVIDAIDKALEDFVPISRQSVAVEDTSSSAGWSEIGGLLQVKEQLFSSILHPVKYSFIYAKAPVRLPRGMLLYGPPGCGKSFLVPAVAKECDFHLITCRGPELLDKYIGASEAKVRQLFARAQAAAPCILFLDEFDALAPRRGSDHTGVTDRVVNQLLTFLDGVEQQGKDKQVYVLAATSRPDKVDPALLRPGRLETHVFVGYPENEDEWNDLFGHIILSRADNVDSEIQELVSSGNLLNSVRDCTTHLHYLSAADMKAAMDTAHLAAVHEHLASASNEQVVKIGLQHLVQALKTTRPSLPPDDRAMLARVYAPFMNDMSSPRDNHHHLRGMLSDVGGSDGDIASGTFSTSSIAAHERPLKTTLR